ncbi:MAG: hypothetical protein A3J38_04700 [Gammaproteobacteria bacterium RIFCSPHIGHO2_12_FULL_45_9]|nr:MAG: hypothetical protein A3J38_04700 [Gammaproteobacteria bacterium RIFCSPHIGHO2_12_FULL_45_9]
MSEWKQKLDELAKKVTESLPTLSAIPEECEKNIKVLLHAAFEKMDLVTREEFEAQQAVLAKTREKLTQLEMELQAFLDKHKT